MMKKMSKSLLIGLLALTIVLSSGSIGFADGLDMFKPERTYTVNTFTDVGADDWFYDDVKDVYEMGIISGKGDNSFSPEGQVTIAETVILAANINSHYYDKPIAILPGEWYVSGVNYAEENEIIVEGEFKNYNQPATRAEVAYILVNALPLKEIKNINNIEEIPDVDSSTKYSESIFKLYNSGIIRGAGLDGEFKPRTYISRAEIASIVNRILQPEKRQKFGLGDLLYTNKKYGFSMVIPRSWVGNYEIDERVANNGRDNVDFYLVKDGKRLINLFNIEMVHESDFDYEENLTRWTAGKNRSHLVLISSSNDINDELAKPENKAERDMYFKMMNEYLDELRPSIRFIE